MHTYWMILISTPNVPISKFKYQSMIIIQITICLIIMQISICLIIVQSIICLIIMQILYSCQIYNAVILMHNSKYDEYQKKPSCKMHKSLHVTPLSNYYILGSRKGYYENFELQNYNAHHYVLPPCTLNCMYVCFYCLLL